MVSLIFLRYEGTDIVCLYSRSLGYSEEKQKEKINSKSTCLESLQFYIHNFFSLKQSCEAGTLTVLFDM